MISLDTETNGLDFFHGARPFLVTACEPGKEPSYWEWEVNPLTRIPTTRRDDLDDLDEIQRLIDSSQEIVCHNGKFDAAALATLGVNVPWGKLHDTLIASHVLSSNTPHDLTSLVLTYLDESIGGYEEELKDAVKLCRAYCRANLPDWRITTDELPEAPSASGETWRHDYWLPRAVSNYLIKNPVPAPAGVVWKGKKKAVSYTTVEQSREKYLTVLSDYACADSFFTARLWPVLRGCLERRGLWEIYLERMKLLPVASSMERRGLTVNGTKVGELSSQFSSRSDEAGAVCVGVAESYGYDLDLPRGGKNKSLDSFVWDVMQCPPLKLSAKTGDPSLDAETKESLELYYPKGSKEHTFFRRLNEKASCDKAVTNLAGYTRFWLPTGQEGWYRLHPHTNPTGTDTLRWGFSNPNQANISKQEGYNLRYAFGPMPGRVWYSADAQNIELRIPAFEAGEEEQMRVFLTPGEPPYFGSYHLVVFDTLHPELFAKHGKDCKTLFESTWYQWVKNGNFAIQYGAQENKADATYRVKGAFRRLRGRFPKIAALSDRYLAFARKHGYVETIPDKTVCPDRGYPLLASRKEGKVVPTTPFCYHVSGTAMQWMNRAMVRCHAQLGEWNREDPRFDGFIAAQVHDELLFDLPAWGEEDGSNPPKVNELRELMELGGGGIGIPTPVSVERHTETWAVGTAV